MRLIGVMMKFTQIVLVSLVHSMISRKKVYHKSCYKSYTSEHNIVVFTSRQTDEVAAGPSKDSKDPSMLTRSKSSAINWSACISRCPCSMKTVQ